MSGFQVYFRAGACDLKMAAESLADYDLKVTSHSDNLVVRRRGSPTYEVRISSTPSVVVEAREFSEGTPHAASMKECDSRFDVSIADLDAALDEFNTLMEVECALQEACNGFVYLPWNGNVLDMKE